MNVRYIDLVQSLVGMACQFIEGNDGKLNCHYVSATENCIEVLEGLGLVVDGEIIPQAFDYDYLNERFKGK